MSSVDDFRAFLDACKQAEVAQATCGDMSVSFPPEMPTFAEYKPEELSDEDVLFHSAGK